MATDVQARESGNSAMVIALVVLVLLVIGAFAFFGMGNRTVETPGPSSTTVVTQPAAPTTPDVHVDVPPPVVVGGGVHPALRVAAHPAAAHPAVQQAAPASRNDVPDRQTLEAKKWLTILKLDSRATRR